MWLCKNMVSNQKFVIRCSFTYLVVYCLRGGFYPTFPPTAREYATEFIIISYNLTYFYFEKNIEYRVFNLIGYTHYL